MNKCNFFISQRDKKLALASRDFHPLMKTVPWKEPPKLFQQDVPASPKPQPPPTCSWPWAGAGGCGLVPSQGDTWAPSGAMAGHSTGLACGHRCAAGAPGLP